MTEYGVDCNGAGKGYIETINGCKDASRTLGKNFGGSNVWNYYQTGCIQFQWINNNVYWNGMEGKANAKGRSICHGTGKPICFSV